MNFELCRHTGLLMAVSRGTSESQRIRKAAGMAQKSRAWQRMLSGRRLDLLDPTPVDIEIEDIARLLDVPTPTAKTRLRSARLRLRELIERQEHNEAAR